MYLISIFDKNLESWSNPYCYKSEKQVMRDMQLMLKTGDKNSLMVNFPEQFDVYIIGSFDENTGIIEPGIKLLFPLASLKE